MILHLGNKMVFDIIGSHFASQSIWVKREWKVALKIRGLSYIDPIPLEDPAEAPPPVELSALHFNDAYLIYLNYLRYKRELEKVKLIA